MHNGAENFLSIFIYPIKYSNEHLYHMNVYYITLFF